MKRLVLFAALVSGSLTGFAQQDPLYSQYLNNPMVINPAYAGINNNLNASISYRNQWAGFDGHPTTINFNSHIALVNNKVGAGILLVQDKLGNVSNTEFQAAFSYKLQLDKSVLSFGMQAGFINFRNNFSQLNLTDPADPAFTQNENLTKPNIGAGVILKSEKYFIGLSVPRLMSTTISNGGQDFQLYDQHYYLFGAYIFFINQHLRFKPSALIKGVKNSPLSVDLNLNVIFEEKYTAGLFTRNFNTYGLILQAKLSNKFKFGYTFEIPTNNSVGTRYNTNELFLGIAVGILNSHDKASITNF